MMAGNFMKVQVKIHVYKMSQRHIGARSTA